jgi:hypothetical protein
MYRTLTSSETEDEVAEGRLYVLFFFFFCSQSGYLLNSKLLRGEFSIMATSEFVQQKQQ